MINSSAITVQIGWFQVLKGYIPEDWTSMQEGFYRSQRSNSERSIHAMDEELIEFFWTTQRPGRSQWHIYLTRRFPTTPALAYDKRLNNELKQHTRTVAHVTTEESSKCHWKTSNALPHCGRGLRYAAILLVSDASTQIKLVTKTSAGYFSQATLATTDDTAPPVTSNTRFTATYWTFDSAFRRKNQDGHNFLRYPPYFPGNDA
jgi:hypothetical protein